MRNRAIAIKLLGILAFVLLITGCIRKTTAEKSKGVESAGLWREGDNSIGWIPTHVYNDRGFSVSNLEAQIKENLNNPNFNSLKQQNLFNRNLFQVAEIDKPWSAGFFPSWFDGVAGRWSKGFLSELFGYSVKSEKDIIKVLLLATVGAEKQYDKLFELSPMEKYDLVLGDYKFGATRRELGMRGHTRLYMAFWVGYCNGVSAAAIQEREPFRRVDVIGADGYRIPFHPYDIKGLLGVVYYKVDYESYSRLGQRCKDRIYDPYHKDSTGSNDDEMPTEPEFKRYDRAECRGVNPATFVLALQNRLGIAKESFVIDKMQDLKVSNHPIGDARVDILKGPYNLNLSTYGDVAAPGVTKLVDVKISVWLGSTALSDSKAVNEEIDESRGLYRRIGFVPEEEDNPRIYYATLELDRWHRIVGGEWGIRDDRGGYAHSNQSPDFAWFGVKPLLVDAKRMTDTLGLKGEALKEVLKKNEMIRCKPEEGDVCDSSMANPLVKWPLVKAIYEKSTLSIEESPNVPVIDLVKEGLIAPKFKEKPWQWVDSTTSFHAKLRLSDLTVNENSLHLSGYIAGRGESRDGGVRLPWRPDVVRVYAFDRDGDFDINNMGAYRQYFHHLDDYEMWRVNINPSQGRYHFRIVSDEIKRNNKQVVLFFYRWQRKDGERDKFVEDHRGKKKSSLVGMYRFPLR